MPAIAWWPGKIPAGRTSARKDGRELRGGRRQRDEVGEDTVEVRDVAGRGAQGNSSRRIKRNQYEDHPNEDPVHQHGQERGE